MDEHGPDVPADTADLLVAGARRHGVHLTKEEVRAALEPGNDLGKERLMAMMPATQRRYLPTLADLVDRLTIVQLKEICITEHAAEYRAERALIQHDIDLMLTGGDVILDAEAIRLVALVMLANRYIWENETKARAGGPDQDRLLKLTHSINGVRNAAKNALARAVGDSRLDYKVDCFAADLVAEFGNWNVLNGAGPAPAVTPCPKCNDTGEIRGWDAKGNLRGVWTCDCPASQALRSAQAGGE